MNVNEATTLVKMAIVCTLVTLVIGALMSTWYILSDRATGVQKDWEDATHTAAAEKLYSLQDQSLTADKPAVKTDRNVIEAHPLVTTVAGTLGEFTEDSLIYIYIVENCGSGTGNYKNPVLYTYPNVTISSHGSGDVPKGWASRVTYDEKIDPCRESVKELLKYSKYRCHVSIQEVEHDHSKFMGLVVEVLTMPYS